jgi:hypothetical protein
MNRRLNLQCDGGYNYSLSPSRDSNYGHRATGLPIINLHILRTLILQVDSVISIKVMNWQNGVSLGYFMPHMVK